MTTRTHRLASAALVALVVASSSAAVSAATLPKCTTTQVRDIAQLTGRVKGLEEAEAKAKERVDSNKSQQAKLTHNIDNVHPQKIKQFEAGLTKAPASMKAKLEKDLAETKKALESDKAEKAKLGTALVNEEKAYESAKKNTTTAKANLEKIKASCTV